MNKPKDWLTQPGGIAERLRALHDATAMNNKELAARLGWAESKVSRLRNGVTGPSLEDLAAWAGATNAEDALPELEELRTQALRGRREDFAHQMRQGQAGVQRSFNELAAESRVIRNFQMVWVPSFMQTRAYARLVIEDNQWLHGEGNDIEEAVTARMERRAYLNDPGRRFEFLLDETVLLRNAFPADVMVPQLNFLLDWIDAPNVKLGILPLRGTNRLTPRAPFQMYDDLVIEEGWAEEYEPKPDMYLRVFNRLFESAAVGDDARALIYQAIGLWGAPAPGQVERTSTTATGTPGQGVTRSGTPHVHLPGVPGSPVSASDTSGLPSGADEQGKGGSPGDPPQIQFRPGPSL